MLRFRKAPPHAEAPLIERPPCSQFLVAADEQPFTAERSPQTRLPAVSAAPERHCLASSLARLHAGAWFDGNMRRWRGAADWTELQVGPADSASS